MEQLSGIVLAVLGAILAMVLWPNKSGKAAGKAEARQEAAKEAAVVAEEVAVERAEQTHALSRADKFAAVVERFKRSRTQPAGK